MGIRVTRGLREEDKVVATGQGRPHSRSNMTPGRQKQLAVSPNPKKWHLVRVPVTIGGLVKDISSQ